MIYESIAGFLCRSKDPDSLGVITWNILIVSPMTKCIWRVFNDNERNNWWRKLLRAKYNNADNIFLPLQARVARSLENSQHKSSICLNLEQNSHLGNEE
jgi:hypothetical protein